ncbi:MAG: glycerol-3-phosphate acyltransferase PlsX, partial [Myxococcota bacterium]
MVGLGRRPMVTVALDALGGDHGVAATVAGAAQASLDTSGVRVLLVGDTRLVAPELDRLEYDPARLVLVDARGSVSMHSDPREALDRAPDCSVLTAARLVAAGEAAALVSAGHTGATILAAARHFNRLPGVRRAALASVYPTESRHGPHRDPFALMLDVGATLSASADDLVSFAVMGSAYSTVVSSIQSPRVALLSNGAEPSKGTEAIREAHLRLARSGLNFSGNVEGLDIPRGAVDVVVCDGFLGNVVLKMLEGVGDVFRDIARDASGRRLQWRIGLSMLGG